MTESQKREAQLAGDPIPRLVARYSLPAIAGMLVNAAYNVVDRYWIGQLNDVNAMSGIGLTMPLMMVMLGFMLLIGVGTTASISIRLGQQRREDAERLLGNGLTLSLIAGGLLAAVGLATLEPLLRLVGASVQTMPYALSYARIILYGTLFNTVGFAMNHTIRGSGNPRRSAATQILGASLNMVLDPIFIFVFDLGVQGAAIATVISQVISAIWVMSYFFKPDRMVRLRLSCLALRSKAVRQILSIGASPFLMQIAASVVSMLANRALKATGGDIAIGAMTVINSIAILFLMPIFGINQGLQPILGYNYGAGRYDRVRSAWLYGISVSTVIVSLGFVLVQLFPATIIRTFINDPGLIEVGTYGIRVFLSMLPLLGFQIISAVYFQSVGKARTAILASLLRQVIILLPLYLVLPVWFGLRGVWFASPIADFMSTFITGVLIWREMRLLNCLIRQEQMSFAEQTASLDSHEARADRQPDAQSADDPPRCR